MLRAFCHTGEFLKSKGERPVTVTRLETVEDVLKAADVVSLHCNLDANTHHLINADRLNLMKVQRSPHHLGGSDKPSAAQPLSVLIAYMSVNRLTPSPL